MPLVQHVLQKSRITLGAHSLSFNLSTAFASISLHNKKLLLLLLNFADELTAYLVLIGY